MVLEVIVLAYIKKHVGLYFVLVPLDLISPLILQSMCNVIEMRECKLLCFIFIIISIYIVNKEQSLNNSSVHCSSITGIHLPIKSASLN